jgi:hypothetical protein
MIRDVRKSAVEISPSPYPLPHWGRGMERGISPSPSYPGGEGWKEGFPPHLRILGERDEKRDLSFTLVSWGEG